LETVAAPKEHVGDDHVRRDLTELRHGIILANRPIDRTQSDHRKVLTEIRASGADLVYMGGRSSTGAPGIVRQMRATGLVAPHVQFLGPGQLLDASVLEEATCEAALATNMRITFAGLPPSLMKGTARKTYEEYVKRFGQARSAWDLYAVEAGRVVVDAIRRASDELARATTFTTPHVAAECVVQPPARGKIDAEIHVVGALPDRGYAVEPLDVGFPPLLTRSQGAAPGSPIQGRRIAIPSIVTLIAVICGPAGSDGLTN